mmetsp:Transcript_16226/g.32913  ORF Transcript_16226/g.32913 Transcript_16226/m.32913 type:complete len:119 (+) Transcript_16226:218-574(+)
MLLLTATDTPNVHQSIIPPTVVQQQLILSHSLNYRLTHPNSATHLKTSFFTSYIINYYFYCYFYCYIRSASLLSHYFQRKPHHQRAHSFCLFYLRKLHSTIPPNSARLHIISSYSRNE